MTTNLFPKVHSSLTALLSIQKSGHSVENGLIVLHHLLKDGVADADSSEWAAVCSAVAVGIRVLADASIRSEEFIPLAEHYASIVQCIFSNMDVKLSLKWNEHYRPLLAMLLSAITGTNQCVTVVMSSVHSLISYILNQAHLLEEFYSSASISLFGKIVFVCIEVISDENRSVESRCSAADLLQEISCREESVNSLSVVLPGLTSRLSQHMCNCSCNNTVITVTIIEVIFTVILQCLRDDTFVKDSDETPDSLSVTRTASWGKSTAKNLQPFITNLCARLGLHRDDSVRLSLLRKIRKIIFSCTQSVDACLRTTASDLVFLLLADDQKRVAAEAAEFLTALKFAYSTEIMLLLTERIVNISKKLPSSSRLKSEPEPMLRQLLSMLLALGLSCASMAAARSPVIIDVFRSLASTIRVDVNRLSICLTDVKDTKDLVSAIPLKFGVQMKYVTSICKQLASSGIEIVDMLNEELRESDAADRTSLFLLASLIVEQIEPPELHTPLLLLTEFSSDELIAVPSGTMQNDSEITDLSEEASQKTAMSIASLCCLTSSTKKLPNYKSKVLLKITYSILKLCESSNWVLSSAADIALRDLSQSNDMTVSSFLMLNNSYILSHVSLATRSSQAHLYSSRVFEAFLDRVNDPNAFPVVAHIVDNLLMALDIHLQKWTWIILHSLRSFVAAMNRWFPEMKPIMAETIESEDELGNTQIPPREISIVENILSRTKNLLSSEHFPVRIIVMDTLRLGLHFLRFFDNNLLPMIHQNWQSLINRLDDDNCESRRTAFMVMVEMANVGRTFLYRRLRFEAWPKLSEFLSKNVPRKTALPQSASFRMCDAILTTIVPVLIDIEAKSEDWIFIRLSLHLFLGEDVHSSLKESAKRTILTGDETFQH